MILAFSDGATEAQSPAGEQLTAKGFLALAEETLRGIREPVSLAEFSKRLLSGVHGHRGGAELEDDVTLLTLRRLS
jgi:serine phosphatase RsbU (regulator of sigma subunit)